MKNTLLKSLVVAGALAASVGAQADNIGGIIINPGFHIEVASIFENPVFAVGQTLAGFGEVSQINGTANFCAGGLGTCELTYRFGGYTVTTLTATTFSFTGGWINFYVGTGVNNDFNPYASASSAADIAAATNGTLWLTLAGHAINALGNTLAGSGTNIGSGNDAGSGSGLLDVDLTGLLNGNTAGAGAAANGNFNTNSVFAAFGGGNADFLLTSSFFALNQPHPTECSAGILTSCLTGSADLRGLAVPEPATLGLLGAGLLGAAVVGRARRGRKSKA